MKVLQVTTHIDIGGIGNYIISLSKELKKKGVGCIIASSGGALEGELIKENIPHKRLDIRTKFEFGPKVIKSISPIVRIVKDEAIDIIHAHTRVSQVAAFLASRITGASYVTTCHGFFKRRSRRIFDTWGDRVIAISDAVKAHLMEDLGVDGSRISVIYNGVDIGKFSRDYSLDERDRIRESLGLGGGFVIGTIGRLSSVKGQRFLIEAMKDIVSKRNDAKALIVGGGKEGVNLRAMAGSVGIEGSVVFVGSDPDTHKFLSVMDIFVFPSIKEGLGLALLEALASGRPCIASNVGGINNIIEDGVSGLLVPVTDSRAISDAVLKLLNDEALRKTLGEAGRRLAAERFSLDAMAHRVIELYEKVIGSRG